MDWLLLLWLFGGRRDRYVTVETPSERETRLRKETEARAALVHKAGEFLRSWPGQILAALVMLAMFPVAMSVLMGGDVCAQIRDTQSGMFTAIASLLSRC